MQELKKPPTFLVFLSKIFTESVLLNLKRLNAGIFLIKKK